MTRRRFVHRDGQLVEVSTDYTGADRRAQTATEEIVYGGAKASDGTPINTRRRHREYLKATGSAMMSDYDGGHMEKKAKEREAFFRGDAPGEKQKRIESLVRNYEKIMGKRR